MMISLGEIATKVNGRLTGDPHIAINGAAIIRDALPGQITLVDKAKLVNRLRYSSATAALVAEGLDPPNIPFVTVADVHHAFAIVVATFHPPRTRCSSGISALAHIHASARIGENCQIDDHCSVAEDVVIGRGSVLHSGVRIGPGCRIGDNCTLFPNVVLYENSIIGDRCLLHAGAIIGAYGFGYETKADRHHLSAQLGYVEVGNDVEIGACSTIDRGTYGPTTIGEGTKIDNQVMIAHNCRIGKHNLICSLVGIAGSCTTGDHVVLAGQVGVRDHIQIGDRAVVGAQAGVMSDVPADCHYLGSPAMPERDQMHIFAAESRLPEMRKQLKALQRAVDELTSQQATKSRHDAA